MSPKRTSRLMFGVHLWSWLRQVTGDAAYENYLRAIQRDAAPAAAANAPFSSQEFYLDALRRRYSTISRCC